MTQNQTDNEHNQNWIGMARLSDGLIKSKRMMSKLRKLSVEKVFEADKWMFDDFDEGSWPEIWKAMEIAQCSLLSITRTRKQLFIETISMPNYSKLKQLSLSCCSITTIQPLQFMYFPQLAHLDLTFNSISSTKPLEKLNLPLLCRISIKQNQFVCLQSSRLRTNHTAFYIDYLYQCWRSPTIQLFDCYPKLQSENLYAFGKSHNRKGKDMWKIVTKCIKEGKTQGRLGIFY